MERGPLQSAVAAKGTLNAIDTVPVNAQLSGQIAEILVDFNTPVKTGQVLARLDSGALEQRIGLTRADIEAAKSALSAAQLAQASQAAEAERARRSLAEAERDLNRRNHLAERGFISPAELAKARARHDASLDQSKIAAAQLAAAETQVAGAQAALKQREGLLARALSDLERASVRAPVDGTVVLRNAEVGQSVVTGPHATALFAIAENLQRMQVEVALGEADAARLKPKQPASFTVEALPRRSFAGELQQVRKAGAAPDGAAFAATILAENPELQLLPGMAASVRILVDARDNVLKVPNGALRFRPEGAPADGSPQLWVRNREGGLRPVAVRAGISDGVSTEILEGPLKEGDSVIVGATRPE